MIKTLELTQKHKSKKLQIRYKDESTLEALVNQITMHGVTMQRTRIFYIYIYIQFNKMETVISLVEMANIYLLLFRFPSTRISEFFSIKKLA